MKFFRSIAVVLACLTISGFAQAENWVFNTEEDAHNMLIFTVSHQGFSNSVGIIRDFHGAISLDEENIENSTVWAEINPASVDMAQHEAWTNNTKSMFFDTENFPSMRFESTAINDLGDGAMQIEGELSMVGITKSITLDAKLNRIGQYMDIGPKAGFSATASLDRTDWGIDDILDLIPEGVDIQIEIEAFPELMEKEAH